MNVISIICSIFNPVLLVFPTLVGCYIRGCLISKPYIGILERLFQLL